MQPKPHRYPEEEYCALDEAAPEGVRLEYFDGYVYHKASSTTPACPSWLELWPAARRSTTASCTTPTTCWGNRSEHVTVTSFRQISRCARRVAGTPTRMWWRVARYTLLPNGWRLGLRHHTDLGETIRSDALDVEVALADLYRRVF